MPTSHFLHPSLPGRHTSYPSLPGGHASFHLSPGMSLIIIWCTSLKARLGEPLVICQQVGDSYRLPPVLHYLGTIQPVQLRMCC